MSFWTSVSRVVLMVPVCGVLLAARLLGQDTARIFAEASAHFDRNEYAAAIARLATIPETVEPKSHIRKHLNTALALMNLGRHIEALPHTDEARGIARHHRDIAGEANVEMAQGNYHRWSRHRAEALRAFERGVQLAEQSGDRRLLASAYSRLATGYRDVEDWARGMHFSDKSFELRQDSLTISDRFNREMDRGIAYFEMYDRDAAEAAFRRGLALAIESRGLRNESFATGELGYVYWAFDKDAVRALEYYDRTIALANAADVPICRSRGASAHRGDLVLRAPRACRSEVVFDDQADPGRASAANRGLVGRRGAQGSHRD